MTITLKELTKGTYFWAGDPGGGNPDGGPDGVVFVPSLELDYGDEVQIEAVCAAGKCHLRLRTGDDPGWGMLMPYEITSAGLIATFEPEALGLLVGQLDWDGPSGPVDLTLTLKIERLGLMDAPSPRFDSHPPM